MAELRVKETGTIKLFESDNTSSVTIASPASLGADRTVTLPDASVTLASGTMLATDGSGASLTALNASELGSGTVPTARLGSGTASSSTVLYGDQTYKTEPGGATAVTGLTDVLTQDTNFAYGFLFQTGSAGSAPTTGTLSSAEGNIGIGYDVLKAMTTDTYNIAIGYNAMAASEGGNNNIGIGKNALDACTSGASNIAIGKDALSATDTESDNVCIGRSASISANSGAAYNVVVGNLAGEGLTSGQSNTIIGYDAGDAINSGCCNLAIGRGSGAGLETGSNSTCIGYNSSPAAAGTNNSVTLGNADIGSLRCDVQTISSLSDRRDKEDIVDSPFGLDFIDSVRPVQFKWNRRVLKVDDENCVHNGKTRIGFIAQELNEVMPDGENDILKLVSSDNPERLEAAYGVFTPILVKAVQELSAEVKTLKDKITTLENK